MEGSPCGAVGLALDLALSEGLGTIFIAFQRGNPVQRRSCLCTERTWWGLRSKMPYLRSKRCYHRYTSAHQPRVASLGSLRRKPDAQGPPTEIQGHPDPSLQQSASIVLSPASTGNSITGLLHVPHSCWVYSHQLSWNVLVYSGIFWIIWSVLPLSSIPPSSLCSNNILSMSPTLTFFLIQSSTRSVTFNPSLC